MDECGGIHIHFPNEGSGSDKVIIRGPKEEVEKAKKQLVELANERVRIAFMEFFICIIHYCCEQGDLSLYGYDWDQYSSAR